MNVAATPVVEVVISREIAAPRARVFAAWTDASQALLWMAPKGVTLLECKMDVREGGGWLRRMRRTDGSVITKYGAFREIVSPERLVFTYNTTYADGSIEPETLVTVTLDDLGGRTRLTLRHANFATGQSAISHRGGWTTCLERFVEFTTAQ